ncbi:CHAD domain-containing protein [Phycicoccus sp. Root563]|uniref:CHAD domain-containing protein n=1 Tax=Phycicoccus sp. Root563 TaxID=1736562 RepID=UPI0009E702D3|nr:CHAD domain-containing protein [Phycicoccus sp. Root563]
MGHRASGDRWAGAALPVLDQEGARRLVAAYLAQQCAALVVGDQRLGAGDDSAVHDTRVAGRRIRSTLRVYSPLFDREAADALDGELRWWSGLLGAVRDLQVLQGRLDTLVSGVDPALPRDRVRARIDAALERDRLEHWTRVREAHAGVRHRALLVAVTSWGARPAWSGGVLRSSSAVATMVDRADRTVDRTLRRAAASDDLDELHRARKAAKRARYAAEVLLPVVGPAAAKSARRHERLQEALGEHRDCTVGAELLLRLGSAAGSSPGESFVFGVLHERELRRAQALRAEVQGLVRRRRRPSGSHGPR